MCEQLKDFGWCGFLDLASWASADLAVVKAVVAWFDNFGLIGILVMGGGFVVLSV